MTETNNKLAQLKKEYTNKLPDKITEIQQLWMKLKASFTVSDYESLAIKVHSIHGSSGIYGYQELTQVASEMENLLGEKKNKFDDDTIQKIDALIPKLVTASQSHEVPTAVAQATKRGSEDNKKIGFLIASEDAKRFTDEAKIFGYEVDVFTDLFAFTKFLADHNESVLVIDIDFISDFSVAEMEELQNKYIKSTPIIFISRSGEFSFRLKSVKANGEAFFLKALPFSELAEEIERIMSVYDEQYRVLIIDDDKDVADYYSEFLKQSNIMAKTINSAKDIDQALHEFNPDVILTDYHMPECDGKELSLIIRQQRAFEAIPIIFLSSEEDRQKQLNALTTGADDFVSKSTKPEYLLMSIVNKAKRYKKLRRLMTHDSLTGLLSYAAIMKHFDDKFKEAHKSGKPFTIAIVKIDNFKQLNEVYGYAAFDQVINTMAQLLRDKLRLRDVVGRYGNSEFLILLPDTDTVIAKSLLSELRSQFKKTSFWWDYRMFSCTFSAGLAAYPNFTTSSKLLEAAKETVAKSPRDEISLAGEEATPVT